MIQPNMECIQYLIQFKTATIDPYLPLDAWARTQKNRMFKDAAIQLIMLPRSSGRAIRVILLQDELTPKGPGARAS